MKHKFSSMGRVAIALVLALSLSLVMAVPVAAIDAGFSVENKPDTVGRDATYTIVFNTEKALYGAEPDTITITFPEGTTVPGGPWTLANTKVNGEDCTDVTGVTGDDTALTVTIDVPQELLVAGEVTVVIDAAAGIANPGEPAATDLTLFVQTSEEPANIESAAYSTTAIAAPYIVSVVGTAYQNSNDTIVITFSEAVVPDMGLPWGFEEFDTIKCSGITLELDNMLHDFAINDPTNTILTITLDGTVDYLITGTGNLVVTPASEAIANEWGDAYVAVTPVTGSVTGDTVEPTVALTYDISDRPVQDDDTLVITAAFSEAMQDTPTIAIDTQGTDLEAIAMFPDGEWTYTYPYIVPAGSDGTATVTISGFDLAGNANHAATNNTFVIDNTAPAILDIVGTTVQDGGDIIVITFSEPVEPDTPGDWGYSLYGSDPYGLIREDGTELWLDYATFSPETGFTDTLTITLDEADDLDYLVNGQTITFTPRDDEIHDAAGNCLPGGEENQAVSSSAVTGDLEAPTIIGIVGVQSAPDFIEVVFSEAVVAADGTWSLNEIALVESPDGAPLNITHATPIPNDFPGADMATVLTIILDETYDDASLVPGEVICVTPAEGAIVDLAGNPLAADEATSGGEAGWLEVWVDDDGTDAWLEESTNFDSIQNAINAVAIGGTVNVLDGSYTEPEGVVIATAGITIQGESLHAIVDGSFGISPYTDGITIDGLTILNGGPCAGLADFVPAAIGARDSGGHTFSNNVLIGANDTGVSKSGISFKVVVDTTIDDNEIYGWGYGVILGVDSANAIISNNYIYDNINCGIDTGDMANDAVIEYNDIYGNNTSEKSSQGGIVVWKSSGWAINFNNIYDNFLAGLYNRVTETGTYAHTFIDATDNWWGSPNGPGEDEANDVVKHEGALIDVDYSSWLDAPYPYGEPTTTTDHYAIDLVAGWNLISLPLIPEDETIETVLANLIDEGTVEVQAYSAGSWLKWATSGPWAEDPTLTLMKDGVGFWLNMSAVDVLVATGYELCKPAPAMPPEYPVVDGWNLIGYKFTVPGNIQTYLGTVIYTDLQAIYGYEASTGNYFIPDPYEDGLEPGYGYWIALTLPGTIYPTLDEELPPAP